MANTFSATAANIISSLGIRGATIGIPEGESAEAVAGFIPILGPDGKLNVAFIPPQAAELQIAPLSNVVIVDPNTQSATRTGSIVAPYKTIHEAAAATVVYPEFPDKKRKAIILAPGVYSSNENAFAEFVDRPDEAYFIGLGECKLDMSAFNVSGVSGRIYFRNIVTDNTIKVLGCAEVVCTGNTYVGNKLEVGAATIVRLSSEARIASTDAESVGYLSDAAHVGYGQSTVNDALDRLDGRRIRVANITFGDEGFEIGEPSYVDCEAQPESGIDVYDLQAHELLWMQGINRLVKLNKNIVAESVTADTISASKINARELHMDALVMGGYKLGIDAYGYLVVLGSSEEIHPPRSVIALQDTVTSTLYYLSIANGRLYVDTNGDESVVPESSLTVIDPVTGTTYGISISDGQMYLDPLTSDSSSDSANESELFAINADTSKYHRIIAERNGQTGNMELGVDPHGLDAADLMPSQQV